MGVGCKTNWIEQPYSRSINPKAILIYAVDK